MNIHELDSYQLSDAIKFHDRLNHRLWSNDEHLHPQVRDKLLEIAQDFQEFLGVPDLDVKDITISGSNAAYNYTNHSDIDLHLVVDLPSADSSEVYRELFDAKKYQYNDQHNIKIGGYSVELYVQNPNQEHHSQGIYSLLRNSWISVPKRKQAKIDDISTHSKYQDLSARINDAVTSSDFDRMHSLMAKIKHMRQSGLEQQGEFGSDNLAFKMLRANGLIEKLVTAKTAARDQQLSLQESMRPAPLPVQYGFAEDVSSNPSGVSASTKMFLETENDDEQTVHDFIMYTAKRLGIKHMPHIELHSDPKWSTREQSFGRYTPETHVLEVNLANRHIMDILRTTAHELVHCKQHQTKPLPDGAGKTGSPWENQANAQAGAIMRDYAQANPEKFGDHALGESSGYIPTPAQAKDKRFSTALSVDVQPGQTGREANKMSLQTDAQGRPALLISGLKNALHESKHSVAEGSLNEGLAHPIIVVDVQPEYSGMNDGDESSVFPQIINFVNKQTGPVLMFVNAEDQGLSGDTIPDIKQYWDDTICPEEERYIHDEETDEYIENSNCPRINWQRFAIADKGYGYFRSWMDHGIEPATIIATIRELYQQKKSDSRELQFPASNQRTPQQSLIMGAMQEMEDDPISVNWTSVAQLKRFNGAYIVGGARDQCLREVELLMNAFNIKYKRIDSLIYEGQQGVTENFDDGKNPGRKGLAKRSGVNTKASVSSLRKTAKHSTGEKARMAHWLANMKSGKAKHKGVAEGEQPGKSVTDAIQKVMPTAQEIWFHGSRATGKHRKNSDTDILVVVPDDLIGDQYLGVVRILQKLSSHFDNYDIQPTKVGTNVHRIAQEEGQLLWSNKQGVAEGSGADNNVIDHMAKNLTGSGSPIAKIRHKRDTEREQLGPISYGYRQDPNLKTTHKQVPFSEDVTNESLDQPYKILRWEKGDFGDVDAITRLDDGTFLSIMFNKGFSQDTKEEAWSVEFYRNNSQAKTGEGDQQRVFATVLSAIQTFIKKYKPNKITFSASKEVEPDDDQRKALTRARLYDSLVQRYAKAWGFRAFRADNGNIVIYQLSRINKDVTEAGVGPAFRESVAHLKALGYKHIGSGADARVWAKDTSHVIKILMPDKPGNHAEITFKKFYRFCELHPEISCLPIFNDVNTIDLAGEDYTQIDMEHLQPIAKGSIQEAMVWILSDYAQTGETWQQILPSLTDPETWEFMSNSRASVIARLIDDEMTHRGLTFSKTYATLFRIMKVLYQLYPKEWDLHTENVMQRANGELVIIDPWFSDGLKSA